MDDLLGPNKQLSLKINTEGVFTLGAESSRRKAVPKAVAEISCDFVSTFLHSKKVENLFPPHREDIFETALVYMLLWC